MLNNAASREQVSASQIVRSSNRMGLGVRRSQAVSSHRADKNGSRFDGHEFSKISSIRSGRSRLRRLLKLGGRNEHDDAGHLPPGEEKKNKVLPTSSFAVTSLASFSEFRRMLTACQSLPRAFTSSLEPSEIETTSTPSYENHGRRDKQAREHTCQLQKQNDQQARLIAELRLNIEAEVEKSKLIRQSANKMVLQMESRELLIGRQDSDEAIYSRFRNLIGQIKTWSVPFAIIRQTARGFSMEAIEEFRKVCPGVPDLERFLHTPRNLRLIVRGYLGFAIANSLFRTVPYGPDPDRHEEDVWMNRELPHSSIPIEDSLCHPAREIHVHEYSTPCGTDTRPHGVDVWMNRDLAYSFASIENCLFKSNRNLIPSRDLHDWRAFTAMLISRLDTYSKANESAETNVTACSARLMSLVANWTMADDREKLEDGLRKILLDAVKLSQTLRCQRAFWSVRHAGLFVNNTSNIDNGDRLLYFDKGTMDDEYSDGDSDGESDGRTIPTASPKIVEVVISPSLWKRGDTDGKRYDVEFCVERSGVKCKTTSCP